MQKTHTGIKRIIIILCLTVITGISLYACNTGDEAGGESIDYTVVEEADYPEELKKLIDEKKHNSLKLTYTTKDYTYVVAGYGTKQTTGYSIRVNKVYENNDTICVDISLIGPAADEEIINVPSTPTIVLKMEKRDKTISFIM